MADIDLFFDLVAEHLSSELNDLDSADIEIKHWVVVEDDLGIAISGGRR
jgi:outer membrane protease